MGTNQNYIHKDVKLILDVNSRNTFNHSIHNLLPPQLLHRNSPGLFSYLPHIFFMYKPADAYSSALNQKYHIHNMSL